MTQGLVRLPNLAATQVLARRLAPFLAVGDVVALRGGLGAGKTTFARALISELMGAQTEVPSPTYTLVQIYDTPHYTVYHFDLYRLQSPDEVFELGWDETQNGVALIEWPDHAGSYLPDWRLDLTFDLQQESRKAILEPRGEDWQRRIDEFGSGT